MKQPSTRTLYTRAVTYITRRPDLNPRTAELYKTAAKRFMKCHGDLSAFKVTLQHLDDFAQWLRREGYSGPTVKRSLLIIRTLCHHA